jgi:6-phosphogluconate dehydrogenase
MVQQPSQTLCVCTGKWTVQQAAELSVAAPTITASLDGRYMSACKDERVAAAKFYETLGLKVKTCGG